MKKQFLAGLCQFNANGVTGLNVTLKIWQDENKSLIFAIIEERDRVFAECSQEMMVENPSIDESTRDIYGHLLEIVKLVEKGHRTNPSDPRFILGQSHR